MTSSIECKNFLRSLILLKSLINIGVENLILCPGSRSAPLALAAGELYRREEINLFNSIDERSAGFHALGISSASGKNVIVISTSGTAVANLLPSSVEADRSYKNIIYLTADRPSRLKDCGANQTVNQEDFLLSTCRLILSTNLDGLHKTSDKDIENLINLITNENIYNPGPIHLNVPIEKPLMITMQNKRKILDIFDKTYINSKINKFKNKLFKEKKSIWEKILKEINFETTGLIIVGPYRGSQNDLTEFNNSLKVIQQITGWPVFSDPVSGVDPSLRGIVENWELLIRNIKISDFDQLLRLGPMPASNILEEFLQNFTGPHFLIKENDSRNLDPLKKAIEYESGLNKFVSNLLEKDPSINVSSKSLIPIALRLIEDGEKIKTLLKNEVLRYDQITELSLAKLVPEIWPKDLPIMISASSPIRDWLTYSGKEVLSRRCFSFRGASGIDGTLSIALGIARVINPLLLVTGELSFLHDINGFLNQEAINLNLKILLIDNNGGNIFSRLYKNQLNQTDLENLFLMKREISWDKLAGTHDIPYRNILSLNKLKEAFEWSLSIQKSVIIKVDINNEYELKQRENIYRYIFHDQ
tara:strand:- start:6833 stop:8599 length:1767 start_codon:yes stop_codon:yes gene_type:complete